MIRAVPLSPLFLFAVHISCGPVEGQLGTNGAAGQNGQNGASGQQGPQGAAGGSAGMSGSRLKLMVLTSSDGAVQPNGFFDSKRNESCAAALDRSGTLRCFPFARALVMPPSYFSDAGCSAPLFIAVPSNCQGYRLGMIQDSSQCGADGFPTLTYQAFSLTPTTPSVVYLKDGANCRSSPPADGYRFWVGSPIPDSEFVALAQKNL